MRFTVSLKVAQTAPSYANEREHESSPSVYQDEHGNRFYVPDHIGDVVMTSDGYAEVIAVSDHECVGPDACEVDELEVPTPH